MSEVGNNAALRGLADSLRIRDQRRAPLELDTDRISVVTDLSQYVDTEPGEYAYQQLLDTWAEGSGLEGLSHIAWTTVGQLDRVAGATSLDVSGRGNAIVRGADATKWAWDLMAMRLVITYTAPGALTDAHALLQVTACLLDMDLVTPAVAWMVRDSAWEVNSRILLEWNFPQGAQFTPDDGSNLYRTYRPHNGSWNGHVPRGHQMVVAVNREDSSAPATWPAGTHAFGQLYWRRGKPSGYAPT